MKLNDIKPYHLFNYQGQPYIINIEDMLAGSIDEESAMTLAMFKAESSAMLDCHVEENLKNLQLLSRSEGSNTLRKEKQQQRSYPIVNMSLFLTQTCNLRCVYCFGDGGEYGTGGSLDETTAFQSVDWLIEQSEKMKHIHIGFFGGEPFLKFPLMKAIVKYSKEKATIAEKKVHFHVTSNATMFEDEVISFIKEEAFTVMVSIDGPKEIHDAQRPYANGKGSYDSLIPKIKKLLKDMPDVTGHAVLVGNTDPEIVKDALQAIGFKSIHITPASQNLFDNNHGKANISRDNQSLLQEREREAKIWLKHIQSKDADALKQLMNKSVLRQAIISLLHNSKKVHACGAGVGMVAVSVTGDVYLCHRFVGQDEYKIGNVFNKSLSLGEYQKSPTIYNAKCSACFARYYCAGGCKHDNAGACGSVAIPAEDMCRLKCLELELAAYIVSNLSSEDREFLVKQNVFPPKPCPLDF